MKPYSHLLSFFSVHAFFLSISPLSICLFLFFLFSYLPDSLSFLYQDSVEAQKKQPSQQNSKRNLPKALQNRHSRYIP